MASAAAATASHLRLLSSSSLSRPLLSKPHLLTLSRSISFQRLTARFAASPTPYTSSPSPSASVDLAQLPPALRDVIALFQSVLDERTRYKQLLAYAARLPAMDPALKTEANRVRGCFSQVWVHAVQEADVPGCVSFQADSDAQLTKGLAALLLLALSGAPARDVAMVPVEFIEMLGIRQSLSPSRNSGLLNMNFVIFWIAKILSPCFLIDHTLNRSIIFCTSARGKYMSLSCRAADKTKCKPLLWSINFLRWITLQVSRSIKLNSI